MKKLWLAFLFLPFASVAQTFSSVDEQSALGSFREINATLDADNPTVAIAKFESYMCGEIARGSANLPEDYFAMALALALNGNYKESIIYHKKALRAHRKLRGDESLEIRLNLGLTYELAGKHKRARRILGEVPSV